MTRSWIRPAGRLGLVAAGALALGIAWHGNGAGVTTVAAGGTTIPITAVDYAFEGVPARVPVGTAFSLVNASPVELHELVAIRIADSETRSVAELVQLPDEATAGVIAEEPAMVLLAPPRAPGFAVLGDGRFTEPGRYALVCFIPTGADPEAFLAAAAMESEGPPEVAGGPPHAFLGMIAEVVVE
ncbi:MAG: hypothetical protein AB7N70_26170 [Dehalococcoidia bacterium]